MKNMINFAKSLALIALFAGSTLLIGCNAADLAGPEAPNSQSECQPDCSNGHNL